MGFNKGLLIAILLMSLGFASFSFILFSSTPNYNVTVDSEYQYIFDEYQNSNEIFQESNAIIEGGEVNPEGSDEAVYSNVIVAGKQMRDSGKLFLSFSNSATKILGIPVYLVGILITIILLLAIFGFIRMISKETP